MAGKKYTYLIPAYVEILDLFFRGKELVEVAEICELSITSIHYKLQRIYRILDCSNIRTAIYLGLKQGYLKPPTVTGIPNNGTE